MNTFAKLSHSVQIVYQQYQARLQLFHHGVIGLAFGGGVAMFALYYLVRQKKSHKVKKS